MALVGGGGNIKEDASRLGIPADLLAESEQYNVRGDEVYPDNAIAADVFSRMLTQWDVGMNGPVGMKYESLPVVMKRVKVSESLEDEVFDCFQIMEMAALESMRSK